MKGHPEESQADLLPPISCGQRKPTFLFHTLWYLHEQLPHMYQSRPASLFHFLAL